MCKALRLTVSFLVLAGIAGAATQHFLTFGKWMPVKWYAGAQESKVEALKVRPLYVDGKLKEFTLGEPHEITDRLMVVRRSFRLNDQLPEDAKRVPQWKWQRGGWLLVDRSTGKVSQLTLPEFDFFYSAASWYRDYVAYCGMSDDGGKVYAIVAQLGRKKPLVKKELGAALQSDIPDSQCAVPTWQRQPTRVNFTPYTGEQFHVVVRGHTADVITTADEE